MTPNGTNSSLGSGNHTPGSHRSNRAMEPMAVGTSLPGAPVSKKITGFVEIHWVS